MKETKTKSLEKRQETLTETTQGGPVFIPETDIYEKDDAILVRCDIPGVTQNHIHVTLENNELTISGRQETARPADYDLLSTEFDTGTFERTFRVSQLIDRDKIKARLNNGVLDIELPKVEQAKPHRIEITTGS